MKIGICGNTSLSDFATLVDSMLPQHEIIVGADKSFEAELSNPFGDFLSLDVCVVLLDWCELVPELFFAAWNDDQEKIEARFCESLWRLEHIVDLFRQKSSARIILSTPPMAQNFPAGFIDWLLPKPLSALTEKCRRMFFDFCRDRREIYPLDKTETVESAEMTSAIITQIERGPIKAIALDLDGTLWGGIAGEDGLNGVILNDDEGLHFKNFQRQIVRLYKQGIMLTVCSRNNTCDVMEIFQSHPHMIIRPEMISSWRVNWDDKPGNLLAIASELNVGTDAILFVDDRPSEREHVRSVLPEVSVLDLPVDPSEYQTALLSCSRLWPLSLNADDMIRTKQISQNIFRQTAAAESANRERFLRDSCLEAEVVFVNQQILPRVAQLFIKTNQFNTTTKRYSETELAKHSSSTDSFLLCMSLKDKWSDYGIIAAALVIADKIDSFILSCRAFGLGAEKAFLHAVLEEMRKRGTVSVTAEFYPTAKNELAKGFYQQEGFEKISGDDEKSVWQKNLDDDCAAPDWIRIFT